VDKGLPGMYASDPVRETAKLARPLFVPTATAWRTASRSKRAMRWGSRANVSGNTFTATSRHSRVSRARDTAPIPPAPSRQGFRMARVYVAGVSATLGRDHHPGNSPDPLCADALFWHGWMNLSSSLGQRWFCWCPILRDRAVCRRDRPGPLTFSLRWSLLPHKRQVCRAS
jgi:hypothetical protein